MDKIEIIEVENANGLTTAHVIIETETGFTSMPKSVYDEMVAKQDQPTGWVEPTLTKF